MINRGFKGFDYVTDIRGLNFGFCLIFPISPISLESRSENIDFLQNLMGFIALLFIG